MKLLHEQVIGGIVIAIMVIIGLLMSDDPELPQLLHRPIFTRNGPRQSSSVTVSKLSWSQNGDVLNCMSRGAINAMHSMTAHNLANAEGTVPAWSGIFAGAIVHTSYAADGSHAAVISDSGGLWSIDLAKPMHREIDVPMDDRYDYTAVSHNGELIAASKTCGEVLMANSADRIMKPLPCASPHPVSDLRFSKDGRRLLCSRTDGAIHVWDSKTCNLMFEMRGAGSKRAVAAFLPEDQIIGCTGNSIEVWDLESGQIRWRGGQDCIGPCGLATMDSAADGSIAAWGPALSHRIVVWDIEFQQKKFEIDNPSVVLQVKFSPDGSKLAVAGRERIVRIYDMATGREIARIDVQRTLEVESQT